MDGSPTVEKTPSTHPPESHGHLRDFPKSSAHLLGHVNVALFGCGLTEGRNPSHVSFLSWADFFILSHDNTQAL